MRINKLKLINFRCHRLTEMELDKINVIVGRNNSGKTSIKDALEYALTGKNGLTDGRGAGSEILINWEADKAIIELELAGIGILRREIPNRLQIADWSGSKTLQQETLLEKLKADERIIKAVLNTGSFLEMSPNDQKDLLFDLLGIRFNRERIVDEFLKWNQGEIDRARDILLEILPENLNGGGEVFDHIYQKLYNLRREEKKRLSGIEVELANLPSPEYPLPDNLSIKDKGRVEIQYQELSRKRDRLLKEIGQIEAENVYREKLEDRLQRLKTKLKDAGGEFKEMAPGLEDINELQQQKIDLDKKIEDNRNRNNLLKARIKGLKEELKGRQETIRILKSKEKACPLAPAYIKCPLSSEELKEIIKNLESGIEKDGLVNKINGLETEFAEIENALTELEREHEEVDLLIEKKQQQYRAYESKKKEVQQLEQEITAVEKELEDLKQQKPVEDLRNEVEDLDKRLKRGRRLLDTIAVLEKRNKLVEKKKRELEDSRERLSALELLLEAFKPSGIKNQLMAEVIKPIEEEANRVLKELTDGKYKLRFTLDAESFLLAKKSDWKKWAPPGVLSTSELLRFGIILQHVLNSLTGLGFMLIDEADILEPENKSILVSTIMELKDKYEQIIILSTVGEIKPRNPGIEGLNVWWIEDGRVQPVS